MSHLHSEAHRDMQDGPDDYRSRNTLTISAAANTAEHGESVRISWRARAEAALPSWLPAALVFGAVLLISFLTLMRMPAPYVDEGWNANRSWALLHAGRAFGSMDSGIFERYPGYWTYFPLLATAIHAAGIAVLGPTLWAMRMVSFLFGALLLLVVYIAGKRLYGNVVGIVAVAVTALSVPFVLASHLGRHDIVVAALGYWAFVLYLSGDKTRLPYHSFLAGLAIGLTLDIHPNGIVFAPLSRCSTFLSTGGEQSRKPAFVHMWQVVCPACSGLLCYTFCNIPALTLLSSASAMALAGRPPRWTPSALLTH